VAACGGAAASTTRPVPAGPPTAEALRAVEGAAAGALSRTAAVSVALEGGSLFGPGSRTVGTGAFDFSRLRGALSFVPAGTGAGEPVIFTPTAVYVRPPAAAGLLPKGKTWTVADFNDPEALSSSFPKLIAQAETVNPALALSELLWGGAAAAPAGREAVRGQDAARYEVTVDLNRAVAAISGPAQVPFGRAIASEIVALGGAVDGSARPATMRVRAWVAGTGQLVRLALSPPGAGVGAMTTTLGGFGAAVHADPPPAAQVVDVLQLGPTGERENQNGGDSDGG